MNNIKPLSFLEKFAYAMGDASANIAWRGVSTFLLIFYTDVFGITPAAVGLLMLITRFSDGVSDILMGVVGDRTNSKYGKFRPWILWTAAPLGIILSLLFTCPDWSMSMKIAYAYVTYILFTLIYTANNIPYGALMAVMTPDDKERTSIGSYRMVGAFAGGMVVQGALLFLVAYFGNINPTVEIEQLKEDKYNITVSAPQDIENVNIKTENGIATFIWNGEQAKKDSIATQGKSFTLKAEEKYNFIVAGEKNLTKEDIVIVDQRKGYSHAIYLLSAVLILMLLFTFRFTKERVAPPKTQETNFWSDLKDLVHNRPWFILLIVGLMFNIYNNTKQGITVIYFTHYIHDQLLAASYMVALMLASIAGAMATAPLSKLWGKKRLFIYALIFTGAINALLAFCSSTDITAIFIIGILSEVGAAFLPTLFFAMLGDAADYSEYKNGRRATGLVYSAGSFATKFGGGIAAAIIGMVLAQFGYDGQDATAIQGAADGIVMLMSWIPALIVGLGAVLMLFYPLNNERQTEVTNELIRRRAEANLKES